jgi:putative transcriptional regulator
MEGMRWLGLVALALCLEASVRLAEAQSLRSADLGAGKLLVASRDLPDPNFSKSVVLLVQYDEDGVVGLILNRRSKVAISRVLDELPGAKNRTDPVYAGGPVGRTEVLALLRSRRPPGDAKRVFADVFLVSSKEALEKTFAAATDSSTVHVYLGYSGWTEPQLENEMDLGAWYVFQGSAATVFDSDPDSLWPRLIHETELRIASREELGIFRLRAAGGGLPSPY